MRHLLRSTLMFYWAMAFGALAALSVAGGAAEVLHLLGANLSESTVASLAGPEVGGALALVLSLAALLFLWDLGISLIGDDLADEVARAAFAVAALIFSLAAVFGAVQSVSGLFSGVAVHLAALLASYLTMRAEHRYVEIEDRHRGREGRKAVRLMAAGAAHHSMLAKLSGRAEVSTGRDH